MASAEQRASQHERIREFMIDSLKAKTFCWEIDGPPDTGVECIQCWAVPAGRHVRLVLVELYKTGGFDVFPQILDMTYEGTVKAVESMSSIDSGE